MKSAGTMPNRPAAVSHQGVVCHLERKMILVRRPSSTGDSRNAHDQSSDAVGVSLARQRGDGSWSEARGRCQLRVVRRRTRIGSRVLHRGCSLRPRRVEVRDDPLRGRPVRGEQEPIDPSGGVPTRAVPAHLHEPWPHATCRRIDRVARSSPGAQAGGMAASCSRCGRAVAPSEPQERGVGERVAAGHGAESSTTCAHRVLGLPSGRRSHRGTGGWCVDR